jgi:tRNA-specific 2-thiouridylase
MGMPAGNPKPCIVCNRDIRFDRLLKEALALDGDYLATGHYVRIGRTESGNLQLLKGIDPAKDQSYMLYTMTQERLARLQFPVGEYTKEHIREIAKNYRLPVFNRPDSQDLCFLGDGDYRTFLVRHLPEVIHDGPIVNTEGQTVGQHHGLAFYTIGQRRGLGLTAPQPMYVIDKDTKTNTLIVGTKAQLGHTGLVARQVSFVSGLLPSAPIRVEAKIRYKAQPAAATLTPLPNQTARLIFDAPLRGITPGQAVVFYQANNTLGGGNH